MEGLTRLIHLTIAPDLTRCDLRRDPGACFAGFDAWRRQPQVVQPVGLSFIQPLQLVADLAQQIFPPRNVGVGFDTQRRGAIHHAEHVAGLAVSFQ